MDKQTIVNKINSYKGYSQQTKNRVLDQVNIIEQHLDPIVVKKVLSRIPMVMRSNAEFLKKYNKVHSKVVRLERHRYAPEMNCLHFKGFTVSTPGATSLEGAIEQTINYNYNLVKDRV